MAVALAPGDLFGPPAFDVTGEAASVGVRWKGWKKRFTYYLDARGITQAKQAKALLLQSAGGGCSGHLRQFDRPITPRF